MPDSIDLGRYSVFTPPDPFEDHTGPFYFRVEGDARKPGSVHCVLPTEAATCAGDDHDLAVISEFCHAVDGTGRRRATRNQGGAVGPQVSGRGAAARGP